MSASCEIANKIIFEEKSIYSHICLWLKFNQNKTYTFVWFHLSINLFWLNATFSVKCLSVHVQLKVILSGFLSNWLTPLLTQRHFPSKFITIQSRYEIIIPEMGSFRALASHLQNIKLILPDGTQFHSLAFHDNAEQPSPLAQYTQLCKLRCHIVIINMS